MNLLRYDYVTLCFECVLIIDYSSMTSRRKPALLEDVDNPDWVPCLLMGYDSGPHLKKPADLERKQRVNSRYKKQKLQSGAATELFRQVYDKGHPEFKNNLVKQNAWQTIADMLERTVEDCEQRFSILRNQFATEKRKGRAKSTSGFIKSRHTSTNLKRTRNTPSPPVVAVEVPQSQSIGPEPSTAPGPSTGPGPSTAPRPSTAPEPSTAPGPSTASTSAIVPDVSPWDTLATIIEDQETEEETVQPPAKQQRVNLQDPSLMKKTATPKAGAKLVKKKESMEQALQKALSFRSFLENQSQGKADKDMSLMRTVGLFLKEMP
ncbi:hypothetical protein FQR65_LT15948 [Abscondita terminalis]|nr:hypothetical protein FQR65_LT15948 [Abscondita terminalis]